MKPFLFFIMVMSLVITNPLSAEDPVHFNDANLKAAVEAELGVTDPNAMDMLRLEYLVAENRGITDLTGLEFATNMSVLFLRDNQISDISALSGMTNLHSLYINNNQISDISALAGKTNLEPLGLGNNQIRNISALAGLTNLTYLQLNDNQITDISALAGLTNLWHLNLGGNPISDILALAGLTNLKYLSLGERRILSDISALASLTKLETLYLWQNQISDISALSELINLTCLVLTDNQIRDISALAGLTNLTDLRLDDNQISDISALLTLKNLEKLELGSNNLNDEAYCSHLQTIYDNNPGISLRYDNNYSPPKEISASDGIYEDQVCIVWNDVCNGPRLSYYRVYRSDSEGGEKTPICEWQMETDFNDTTAEPNMTYYYWVKAARNKYGSGRTSYYSVCDAGWLLNTLVMGYSLGEIDFDDPNEFTQRVSSDPPDAATHVIGQPPDPNGMIRLETVDGQAVRVSGAFGRCEADRVLVRFKYLFECADMELVVTLSDTPSLGDDSFVDVTRLQALASDLPCPINKDRFAEFEAWVNTASLDLTQGTWLEFELRPVQSDENLLLFSAAMFDSSDSSGDGVLMDDWAVEVQCEGICMDLTGNNIVNQKDFLLIMAGCGRVAGLDANSSSHCLEGAFSRDGFVDTYDILSWDWMYDAECQNLCGGRTPPLLAGEAGVPAMTALMDSGERSMLLTSTSEVPEDMLVLGKRLDIGKNLDISLEDQFYQMDAEGNDVSTYTSANLPTRGNVRMVQGQDNAVYLINANEGILDLASGTALVSAGSQRLESEAVWVQIGLQGTGDHVAGRPVLDAVITRDYVYVAPVVVFPDFDASHYMAAAKLDHDGQVLMTYADLSPCLRHNDNNPYIDSIREIEVDTAGNVYVLNVHRLNQSTRLWRYNADGQGTACNLEKLGIRNPIGMCLCESQHILYMASGLYDPVNRANTVIYGLSMDVNDMNDVIIDHTRTIEINNLQHVTGITKDPNDRLWVAGFNLSTIPDCIDLWELPDYTPRLVRITINQGQIDVNDLPEEVGDLGLPLSIVSNR